MLKSRFRCDDRVRQFILVIAVIFLAALMSAQTVTIRADVTGDRVYDDVKIGENYVLLVDKMSCCKRTKRFVVDECDSLVDVMVEDYHRGIYGKEIAVVQSGENGLFTDIYAYTNNRIERVAHELPGRVMRDTYGMVFCHEQYLSDIMNVTVPCAVDINGLLLEKMSATDEQDTVIVLEPGSLQRIGFHISSGSYQVLCVASDHPGVTFVLQDINRDPVEAEYTDGQLTAIIHAGQVRDVELVIDHSDAKERAHVQFITRVYRKGE